MIISLEPLEKSPKLRPAEKTRPPFLDAAIPAICPKNPNAIIPQAFPHANPGFFTGLAATTPSLPMVSRPRKQGRAGGLSPQSAHLTDGPLEL